MRYVMARLREASTWRGFVLFLAVCGWYLTPEQSEAVIAGGLLAAGVIGLFFPDHAND